MASTNKIDLEREAEMLKLRKGLKKATDDFRAYRLKRLRQDILKQKRINKNAEKLFIKLNDLMSLQIKQGEEIDDLFDKLEAMF